MGEVGPSRPHGFIVITTVVGLAIGAGTWLWPQPPPVANIDSSVTGDDREADPNDQKLSLDAGKRDRKDLLPTTKRVENIPAGQAEFFNDQKAAGRRGSAEYERFRVETLKTPVVRGWNCTLKSTARNSHALLVVLYDAPDRVVRADCFLRDPAAYSRFKNLAEGVSLRLIEGAIADVRQDGSLRMHDCVFTVSGK